MLDGGLRLEKISNRMKGELDSGAAPEPERMTVRDLLRLFGYSRRGSWIVTRIRRLLDKHDLRIVPDFEFQWVGTTISIELDPEVIEGIASSETPNDPTIRIGAIEAANSKPVSVRPDNALGVATTIMQTNDFSQLPVMESERTVKGVISWKSIGIKLSMGQECLVVRDCMDTLFPVIEIDSPLFDSIRQIMQFGYVLVRDQTNKISGIVTSGDVTHQFSHLTGPFLIIGEIEGYLRILIHRKFTVEELNVSLSETDRNDHLSGPEDLTLGGYCRLLQNEERWNRLNLPLDRKSFVSDLNWIREKRNDVMHFDPEGLEPSDVERLENFAKLFRGLRRLNVV